MNPLFSILFWGSGCSGTPTEEEVRPPIDSDEQAEMALLVSSHTDGLVSRRVHPKLRFVTDLAPTSVGQSPAEGTFTLSPEVDGTLTWADARELEFVPDAPLEPGQHYQVTVDLAKVGLVAPTPTFAFEFQTLSRAWQVEPRGLEADETGNLTYHGRVLTADDEDAADVERLLTATQGGKARTVTWAHPDGRSHDFVVEGVLRENKRSKLSLGWSGAALGIDDTRAEEFDIPAKGEFTLASFRPETGGEQYVELRFTDPLDPKQDLAGLIRVEDKDDLRFTIEGSVVRIYSSTPWVGSVTIDIERVKNRLGARLPQPQTAIVNFDPVKPEVRFASEGVILPTTQGLTVPIEVVNVRAIEIEATRVYDTNVPQFLQVNTLSTDRELKRVGKIVWRQRVPVEVGPNDADRWIRLGLDVSGLVAENPAGLYRLKLSFVRPDIVYACAGDEVGEARPVAPIDNSWDQQQRQSSFWDYWDGSGSPYDEYEHREDPCSPGYYWDFGDHSVTKSKNVLVSDIGVIAKQGEDGGLLTVVTDLRTARPSAGAAVRVLDYQLQELAVGRTDSDGFLRLKTGPDPFVVEATVGSQHGYVKLDKGSSLALGHFDTAGMAVEDGLKGFVYAERGVWRPGDDIFLTFVLEDRTHTLPSGHPIHFELVNPRGQVVERKVVRDGVDGFYDLRTRTSPDAPTGPWTARIKVGGRTFTQTLRVETIQPNRLKIAYTFASPVLKGPDVRLETDLESRWLHGADAQHLRAQIDGKLVPKPTSFPKYDGYTFTTPGARWESDSFTVWEGRLDEKGKAHVSAPIAVTDRAPGLLTAELTTRVWEPSGAFSVDQATVTVSPHARYVGIKVPKGDAARNMLLTDTKHEVDLVVVDADGKPAGGGHLDLKLYKVQWRWWWEKGEENLADYAGADSHAVVTEGTVDLAEGKGSWSFEVKYPDWGRYLLVASDEDGDHSTGTLMYIDWPGWAGRAAGANPGAANVLTVTTDQKKVEVGQPITLSFPTPKAGGRALLSLETGTRVLRTAWVEPTGDTTQTTIIATADMAPSVYAHVTLIQPHEATKNDLPMRLYGVLPIDVEDPATKLQPVLVTAAEWQPEGKAKIDVSEKSGRAMTYTLDVVDEGLLGLTRFTTPSPWAAFYGREALGVRTWDVYDQVAGAYGAALEGLIAVGGDGEGQIGVQPQAKRFPPVVIHLGTFQLEAGATRTHELTLPSYVGEVRVMAVAGHDGAYGSAEKAVKVKKPLMVLASAPRVLGPGEELRLPVSVFALDPKVKDVTVKIAVEGPLELVGGAEEKLSFPATGDQLVSFKLRVKDVLGIGKISVTASGAGNTATHSIELQVRHPGVRETRVVSGTVSGGKTWQSSVALPGITGTNTLELEVSRVPPLNLGDRLESLIRYPHGCVEQTTSGAFPQLMLTSVMELTPDQKRRIQHNVNGGIDRLRQFQTADGGFGYWPGDRNPDPWATSYVGQFLLEAERAGYVLPSGSRRAWVGYQRSAANRWVRSDSGSDLQQAYRLYTLALAGEADLASMNRLKDVPMSPAARFRLASAYKLAGQGETARALATGTTQVDEYRELSGTYGSELRDQAMILETLVLLGDDRRVELARSVSDRLSSEQWMSTQETAASLVALSRFAGTGGTAEVLGFGWSVAGAKATDVNSNKPLVRIPVDVPATSAAPIALSVNNAGTGTLFVRAIASGMPPVGEEKPYGLGLALTVTYETPDGGPMDVVSTPHGADLVAEVKVRNTSGRSLQEVALTQIAPSGWELFGSTSGKGDGYDYRDVRDDRVYTYFDLGVGEEKTFTIRANAAFLGRFYLPPVGAEAMYDGTISAHTQGQWIQIQAGGEG